MVLRRLCEVTGLPAQAVVPWPGYAPLPFDINTVTDIEFDLHGIDAHAGGGEPGHQHFELRFLFRLRTATDAPMALREEEADGIEWRPVDQVTSPSLREKLLEHPRELPLALPPEAAPGTANASALIHNDRGEYLLVLRGYFPGQICELGGWGGAHRRLRGLLER